MQIIITNLDGTEKRFECPLQSTSPISNIKRDREWKAISVIGDFSSVKEAFVDNISYRQEWDSVVMLDDGTETTEIQTRDMSEYCVAGDIVDTRDGNITIYMGRKTEIELLRDELSEMDAAMQEGVDSVD